MISYCANPDCGAEFLYLHDGEVFVIELPDRSVRYYWLCKLCAGRMRIVYNRADGAKVVAKSEVFDTTRATGRAA